MLRTTLRACAVCAALLFMAALNACDHEEEPEWLDGTSPPTPTGQPTERPANGTFANCGDDFRLPDRAMVPLFAYCVTREAWTESGIESAIGDSSDADAPRCATCHALDFTFDSVACGIRRDTLFVTKFVGDELRTRVRANHERFMEFGASNFHPRYDYGPDTALYRAVERLYQLTAERDSAGNCPHY